MIPAPGFRAIPKCGELALPSVLLRRSPPRGANQRWSLGEVEIDSGDDEAGCGNSHGSNEANESVGKRHFNYSAKRSSKLHSRFVTWADIAGVTHIFPGRQQELK